MTVKLYFLSVTHCLVKIILQAFLSLQSGQPILHMMQCRFPTECHRTRLMNVNGSGTTQPLLEFQWSYIAHSKKLSSRLNDFVTEIISVHSNETFNMQILKVSIQKEASKWNNETLKLLVIENLRGKGCWQKIFYEMGKEAESYLTNCRIW